jgi:acyl-CoA thioester hydrolase
VRWGECDPAGVVYTPRFAEYVTDAFHEYLEHLFGSSLEQTLELLDLATPCKALRFAFHHSLRPEQELELAVRVIELRRRTFDLGITGYTADECAFEAVFTAICVHRTVRSSRELPAPLRERLEADLDRGAPQV